MTYYIQTEKPKGKNVVLIRSVVRTRRKDIGTKDEGISDDPTVILFKLTPGEREDTVLEQKEDSGENTNGSAAGVQDGAKGTPPLKRPRTNDECAPALGDDSDAEGDEDDGDLPPHEMQDVYNQFDIKPQGPI